MNPGSCSQMTVLCKCAITNLTLAVLESTFSYAISI